MGLSFYVHYYAADYLGKKKAAIKRSADVPQWADVKYSTALASLEFARESLLNTISILNYNPALARSLSEIYTNFIFGTEISEDNKKLYDEQVVKNFQNLFNSSKLNSQFKLYNDTNQVDLLTYQPWRQKASIKNIVYDDNTTEEQALLKLRAKIERYCKMAEKMGGNNGYISGAEAKKILKDFDILKLEIEKNKSSKQGNSKDVVYYDLPENKTKNSLINIIETYNNLIRNAQVQSTVLDQGYYAEALIAGINNMLTEGAKIGAQNLVKYLQEDLQKLDKQTILNDNVQNGLRMTGFKLNDTKQYISNKLFDTKYLEDYFNNLKAPPNKKITVEINGSGGADLMSHPTSTADVLFKYENEDYGISIKNYRKGFKSKSGVHIIKETPLLQLLNLFSNTTFVNHYANITSSLRGPKGGKSTINFGDIRQKMKSTIALALLFRGLAGIKGASRSGGEADFFTMVDASSQKVYVYTTFDLLNSISKIFKEDKNAGLFKNSGFVMTGYPSGSIFENNWEPIKDNESPWDAAKRRNAQYIIAAHKVKLSASIKPEGWKKVFANMGIN